MEQFSRNWAYTHAQGEQSKDNGQSNGAKASFEPKNMHNEQAILQEIGNKQKLGRVGKKVSQRASAYPYDLKQKRKLRKNNREKQRRSELNIKFEKLCTLLGRQSKAEKFTILTDAINLISELRHENQELKIEKIGLRNELVSASVGPGVSEAELEKALMTAFPDQPVLPLDLTPPGSPELGGRHLASSDESEEEGDAPSGSPTKHDREPANLSSPLKPSLPPESFQPFSQTLPPASHLSGLSSLPNFPSLLYKQAPNFLHPQSFPSFPTSSFAPSFPAPYAPLTFPPMLPMSLPLDFDPLMPSLDSTRTSTAHLNALAALSSLNPPAFPGNFREEEQAQPAFGMDQREDNNTFLSI